MTQGYPARVYEDKNVHYHWVLSSLHKTGILAPRRQWKMSFKKILDRTHEIVCLLGAKPVFLLFLSSNSKLSIDAACQSSNRNEFSCLHSARLWWVPRYLLTPQSRKSTQQVWIQSQSWPRVQKSVLQPGPKGEKAKDSWQFLGGEGCASKQISPQLKTSTFCQLFISISK